MCIDRYTIYLVESQASTVENPFRSTSGLVYLKDKEKRILRPLSQVQLQRESRSSSIATMILLMPEAASPPSVRFVKDHSCAIHLCANAELGVSLDSSHCASSPAL